jgi:hypothetical protein
MRADNTNEQSAGEAKQTRSGVPIDDKSKELDSSEGGEAPAAKIDRPAVSQKSGVDSDDKSKGFGA